MSKSFVCQALALAAVLALFVCGQQALAENPHHFQIRSLSPADAGKVFPPKGPVEKKRLEQLSSGFGVLPPVDGGGNDEWPCFPNQNANGADCSSIATGGVVIGSQHSRPPDLPMWFPSQDSTISDVSRQLGCISTR